jgi:hypothetical protein
MALAAAITRILEEPGCWDELHRAGRARIDGSLRLEDQVGTLLDVIQDET